MNKIKITALTLLLSALTFNVAYAIQTGSVTKQDQHVEKTSEQVKNTSTISGNAQANDQMQMLIARYNNNIKNCVPIHFNQYIDLFGLKISLQFDVNGWNQEKKCEVNMTGNIGGIGNDIREVYNIQISDEQIAKIKPIIQCQFTTDELNKIYTVFTESQKTTVTGILTSPEKKCSSKKTLTQEEQEVFTMLTNGTTCRMPNSEEVMQQFSELMMPNSENN